MLVVEDVDSNRSALKVNLFAATVALPWSSNPIIERKENRAITAGIEPSSQSGKGCHVTVQRQRL
jgi:hypothetical protein